MKNIKTQYIKVSVIALCSLLTISCVSQPEAPQVSEDGLQLIYDSDSTIAYQKQGVRFSNYDSILVLPSEVAFKENWQRDYNRKNHGNAHNISDKDALRIKNQVASIFDKDFTEELSKGESKKIVKVATASTLILKPFIINLDLHAPDINTGARTKTYTKETGEATLYLEFFDGESREILARVVDTEIIGDNSFAHWSNRVTNTADTKRTIKKWAKRLNEKFDEAQAE